MKLATGYEDRKARIEMVPLLDVIFLLLSSFVYATFSLTVYKGLEVDLPRGRGGVEDARSVVITIRGDNTIWLNDRQVPMAGAVAGAVAQARGGKTPVVVSGDRSAGLGVAVELLSELRKADVEAVHFRVREEK